MSQFNRKLHIGAFAAPLLAAADLLTIITSNDEAGLADEAAAEQIARYSARYLAR